MWLSQFQKDQPDWSVVESSFPQYQSMKDCIQDPIHHAEGDVWTHTRMVYNQLSNHDLGDDFAARLTALFHDVEKPYTRTEEFKNGRLTIGHPSHARMGAQTSWYDLWQADVDVQTRLEVHALIMWHQRVFHMWSYNDAEMRKLAYQFASLASWDKLINFALSDNAGRICANPKEAVDNLSLLREYIAETVVPFETPVDRMFFFEKDGRDPSYKAQKPTGSRVIIMSGIPGSGKDTHIRNNLSGLPVVSPDNIRIEMGFSATDNQGQVRQATLEKAREYLRAKTPFVWNATNLTRQMRGPIVSLCRDYDAYVEIHALDRPLGTIFKQNHNRSAQVPTDVIERLAQKWEPPTELEAHEVKWV